MSLLVSPAMKQLLDDARDVVRLGDRRHAADRDPAGRQPAGGDDRHRAARRVGAVDAVPDGAARRAGDRHERAFSASCSIAPTKPRCASGYGYYGTNSSTSRAAGPREPRGSGGCKRPRRARMFSRTWRSFMLVARRDGAARGRRRHQQHRDRRRRTRGSCWPTTPASCACC